MNGLWRTSIIQTSEKQCAVILLWVLLPLPSALTYSEKQHHAEHRQQGGDDHPEEDGEFLRLLLVCGPLPGAARVLLRGLPGRR